MDTYSKELIWLHAPNSSFLRLKWYRITYLIVLLALNVDGLAATPVTLVETVGVREGPGEGELALDGSERHRRAQQRHDHDS